MKLKILSVETRQSETKGAYAYGRANVLKKDGSVIENRVIMAFGKQRASVAKFLKGGRNIEVQAVFEGGVIKILGPARARKAPAAKAA
jgi:hypothetical protein